MKKITCIIFSCLIIVIADAQSITYKKYKENKINLVKSYMPVISKNIFVQSQPTEVVDVSNTAKYPTDLKTTFPKAIINADCNALPVNYKSSQQELGLFFPATNFKNAIFPGAVYRFSGIRSQSPVAYTKFINRNPMDLTTDIFDSRITDNRPVKISSFDYGTVSSQWKNILAKYIGGATPANVKTEVILVESNEQMNSALNTAGSVNIATKINVPIPNIPVKVDFSNKVSVTNTSELSNSIENKKNTIVLRFRQVFYSCSMTYRAGTEIDVFPGVNKADLENDLIYISSVDYGQMLYVVITSEYTKEALYKAVMNKVSTETTLGVEATGMPVSGSVSVDTRNQSTSEINQIFARSKTSIKSFKYGGEAIELGTTIDEVINTLKNKIKTRFDHNNLGAPLSYTLNFVSDHSPAWVNTNTSYATANCGLNVSNIKYDVKLTLVKLNAPKVIDNDNTEDLFGELKLTEVSSPEKTDKDDFSFWKKDGTSYNETTKALKNTDTKIDKSHVISTNNSLENISRLKFKVTGKLKDKDFADIDYVCDECNGAPREINLGKYKDQIESMQPGQVKNLKIGEDKFFELNFFENGEKNSSHIKTFWQIEITAK